MLTMSEVQLDARIEGVTLPLETYIPIKITACRTKEKSHYNPFLEWIHPPAFPINEDVQRGCRQTRHLEVSQNKCILECSTKSAVYCVSCQAAR